MQAPSNPPTGADSAGAIADASTGPGTAAIAADGLWDNNPALVQLLGLCPLLAVSTNVVNALGLGIATVLALTASSAAVSLLRPITRAEIRLPLFVLVIASAVSSIELAVRAWLPGLHDAIGLFIPLIVTNCLILGRAEAFAARQRVHLAALDGLMMGMGFLAALVAIGGIREIVGHGSLFADMSLLLGDGAAAMRLDLLGERRRLLLAILPTGAFFVYAGLIAARNAIVRRSARLRPAPAAT
jgi:electron transport complex protein RnfE